MTDITHTIQYNLRKFIQLMALSVDPLQRKWVRDEYDLAEALDVARIKFHETERMMGKKMYKGQAFDPIEDVKREMEEFLFTARQQNENLLMKKKNLVMYHLVVEPVIDLFKGKEHKQMLEEIDDVVKQVIDLLYTMPVHTHYDDALVAREQVRQMVREREERRKAEVQSRKRGKRKSKKNDLDWMLTADQPTAELA
jgi:hypothetical protein